MPTTSPDLDAKIAELKNAPNRVKRVALFGTLLGLVVLLGFCWSAYTGTIGWGKALAGGVFHFLMLWFVSFAIQDRRRGGWWALLILVLLRALGGVAHTLHVLFTIEGDFEEDRQDMVFDALGVGQLIICGVLFWLLFSREVRNHVFRAVPDDEKC